MSYTPLQLAEAFIQAGELPDALDALDAHLRDHPADAAALRLRAAARSQQTEPALLKAALDDLATLPERTPDDYMLQAKLHNRLGDAVAAGTALAAGHTQFPNHERLAEGYLHHLQVHQEFETAQAVLAALPLTSWRWVQWAADLAMQRGDSAAAVKHYDDAIVMIEARYNFDPSARAAILADEGVSDAASLTIGGVYARLILARAGARQATGMLEAALADYDRAAVLIPDDPAIAYNRGVVAFLQGQPQTARERCQPALDAAAPQLRDHLLAESPAALRELLND
jgi:tetratricopeptide (TPR) repeat protein